jgi:heme exporter protein C
MRERALDPLALLFVLTGVALVTALALVFGYAPVERTMGIVQKIFYFHVPSAIAAYLGFTLCCVASVVYLVRGSHRADAVARAGAEVGVFFCTFVLVSGPLWARKAWGTFWTGEPRLLLTLVLLLIFVAYLVVRAFGGRSELTRKIGAVLAILGVVDIPLIRVSVARWRGNHPRVMSEGGIAPEMEVALYASIVAVALLFTSLVWMRARLAIQEDEVERLHRELTDREYDVEAWMESPNARRAT